MTNEILSMMSRNGGLPYQGLQELGDINTRMFTRLANLQLTMTRLGIEGSVEQAKLFTAANKYEDLLSAETDLASSYGEQVMQLSREAAEIVVESREEWMAWMEKRYEHAGPQGAQPTAAPEKPKSVAKKSAAKKPAATRSTRKKSA